VSLPKRIVRRERTASSERKHIGEVWAATYTDLPLALAVEPLGPARGQESGFVEPFQPCPARDDPNRGHGHPKDARW
jgi:hypothetical protein